MGVDRLVLPVGHGVGPHELGGVDALGRGERAVGAQLGLAVDPVDPEGPGSVAVPVVADHVPVPEAQHDAVGIEVADVAPVVERHRRVAAHRVEQRRRGRGVTSSWRQRAVGALPRQAPELGQALAPGVALESYRGDGDVQRGELGLGELELGQVVVVGVDPVGLLGAEAVDGLDPDRDAELAQRLLVALELPPARSELVGVARARRGRRARRG